MPLLPLLALLSGCTASKDEPIADSGDTDTDTDTDADPDARKLAVTLSVDPNLYAGGEPAPDGTFYGYVFDAADVDGSGPLEGALPIDAFSAAVALDPAGASSDVVYTTGALEPDVVAILGVYDLDGDFDPSAPATSTGDLAPNPAQNDAFYVDATGLATANVFLSVRI